MIEESGKKHIWVRLPHDTIRIVDSICRLEQKDPSQLLEELIKEGLKNAAVRLYNKGKITASRGAEILGISLREFLQLLEDRGVAINWDSEGIKDYIPKGDARRNENHGTKLRKPNRSHV